MLWRVHTLRGRALPRCGARSPCCRLENVNIIVQHLEALRRVWRGKSSHRHHLPGVLSPARVGKVVEHNSRCSIARFNLSHGSSLAVRSRSSVISIPVPTSPTPSEATDEMSSALAYTGKTTVKLQCLAIHISACGVPEKSTATRCGF